MEKIQKKLVWYHMGGGGDKIFTCNYFASYEITFEQRGRSFGAFQLMLSTAPDVGSDTVKILQWQQHEQINLLHSNGKTSTTRHNARRTPVLRGRRLVSVRQDHICVASHTEVRHFAADQLTEPNGPETVERY